MVNAKKVVMVLKCSSLNIHVKSGTRETIPDNLKILIIDVWIIKV